MISSAPPKIKSAPSLVFFAAVILGATFFGIAAVVFFFNPSRYGFYPVCLFHQLTGLNCPGCGATRAFYALLHGNFSAALRDNALFVVSLAGAAIFGAHFLFQKRKNPQFTFRLSAKFFWIYLVAAVIFAVLRNLPAFSFLAP